MDQAAQPEPPRAAQSYPAREIRFIVPFRMTPEKSRAYVNSEIVKWSKIIQAADIKPN